MEKKNERVPTRRTTFAILGILKRHSSYEMPLTNKMIRELLEREYEISTSKESVKDILDDLENYFPPPERIVALRKTEDSRNATGYYYELPPEPGIGNDIRRIRAAIVKNKNWVRVENVLSFQFCGIDREGNVVPAGADSVYQDVLPLKVCWSENHPYLVCLPRIKGNYHLWHFRLDLMKNIQIYERKKPTDEARDRKIKEVTALSDEEYVFRHPYMFYESEGNTPRRIRLYITKLHNKPYASFNILRDVFGPLWRVIGEDEEGFFVEVTTLPRAAEQFANVYRDRVKLIQGVKENE